MGQVWERVWGTAQRPYPPCHSYTPLPFTHIHQPPSLPPHLLPAQAPRTLCCCSTFMSSHPIAQRQTTPPRPSLPSPHLLLLLHIPCPPCHALPACPFNSPAGPFPAPSAAAPCPCPCRHALPLFQYARDRPPCRCSSLLPAKLPTGLPLKVPRTFCCCSTSMSSPSRLRAPSHGQSICPCPPSPLLLSLPAPFPAPSAAAPRPCPPRHACVPPCA